METTTTVTTKNATAETNSKNPSRTTPHHHFILITLVVSLTLIFLFPLFSFLISPPSPHHHPLIKSACATTLYPSLCLSTAASLATTTTTLRHLLEVSINRTLILASLSQSNLTRSFSHVNLSFQESNAFLDCINLLHLTVYELRQSIQELQSFPYSYADLKTLLSAAMTNENTCIDGFSDLEQYRSGSDDSKGFRVHLETNLKPILHMISNSLAVIKYMENVEQDNPKPLMKRKRWVPAVRMKEGRRTVEMGRQRRRRWWFRGRRRADVVVAGDGSGDCRTVGEAVRMAPNMSTKRYVIKVKAGVYRENVEIAREKENVMLVGEGMNSTVISGSRNYVDGFSTFTSATLTVEGDKFMARDLTIVNTSPPEKHQAVAARVTSNSAFYRCNFTSYQDTLYAHSLRQFYRDCVIQGTIDFIFGNAAAIFQNCLILARKPIPGQSNVITAQGREDPNQNTGIAMHNCTIDAAPEFTEADRKVFGTYLGRPWRNHSRTVIMRSYLGDMIHPQGWCQWNKYSTLDTVEYVEYLNFGPGSDTRHRVRWLGYTNNCSEDIERRFTVGAFLRGSNDWLLTTGFPFFRGRAEL